MEYDSSNPRESLTKTRGENPTPNTQVGSLNGSPIIRYQYLSLGDVDIDLKLVVNLNRYGEVEVGLSSPEAYLGTIRLSLQDDMLEVFADAVELSVGIFTRLVEDILGNQTLSFASPEPDEDTEEIYSYHDSPRTEMPRRQTYDDIEIS